MVTTLQKLTPHFEFASPDLRAKLRPWCNKVLKRFPKLPPLKLLCYFDNENPEELQQQFGQFSGIHTPILGGGTWPRHVSRHFFNYLRGDLAFDNLIYIPKTQYAQKEVSFVIIFAHELQHFVQWGHSRKVAEANALLLQHLSSFDPGTELKPWGLPNNREAMIVAKRVAEAVCGGEAVKGFIETQVADGKSCNNVSKTQLWMWVRTLTPSTRYDLLQETDLLVQKYRKQLQGLESDINFSKGEWWL